MGWLDQKLEKLFKKKLHKKRDHYIQKAIDEYIAMHHPPPEVVESLRKKLELEADRVYAIVDQSIIRERIKRAKWTFWISAISSIVIVGVLGAFSGGTALPFIIPVCAAFVAWLITLGTIPISYNTRIQGAMDSTIVAFEKEQIALEQAAQQTFNPELYKDEIAGFKNSLVELIQKFNDKIPEQNISVTNEANFTNEIKDLKVSIQSLNSQMTSLNSKIDQLTTAITNVTVPNTANPNLQAGENSSMANDSAFQEALISAFKIYSQEQDANAGKQSHKHHFWHRHKNKTDDSKKADQAFGFRRTSVS